MEDYQKKLAQKGWSQEDIQYTVSVLNSAEKNKSENLKFLDSIIYWIFLLVAIVGNSIIAIILVPLLLTLHGGYLYFFLAGIGLTFGSLFDFLIRDIEQIEQKNVVVTWLFMPAMAIISIFFMTSFSNFLEAAMRMKNPHSPILVGCVYTLAFIFPYFYQRVLKHYRFYRID